MRKTTILYFTDFKISNGSKEDFIFVKESCFPLLHTDTQMSQKKLGGVSWVYFMEETINQYSMSYIFLNVCYLFNQFHNFSENFLSSITHFHVFNIVCSTVLIQIFCPLTFILYYLLNCAHRKLW